MSPPPRDKAYAFLASGTRSATRVLLGVLLARLGGEVCFAHYALLLIVEVILSTLVSCLATTPLQTLAPRAGPLSTQLLGFATQRLWRALALAALLLVVAFPLAQRWGISLEAYAGFVTYCVFTNGVRFFQGWERARFRSGRALWAELWAWALPLCALAGTASLPGSLLSRAWWFLACGNAFALAFLLCGERATPATAAVAPWRREFLALGKPMLIGSIAYSICSRTQPFVLEGASGTAAVATFAAAIALTGPLRVFSMAIDAILRPRLALLRRAAAIRPLLVTLVLKGSLGALTAGVVLAGGPKLIDWIYGDAVRELAPALLAALCYVTLEALGSSAVVWLQVTRGSEGARLATRARIRVCALGLAALYPSCAWGGPAVALLAMAGCEVLFLGLVVRAAQLATRSEVSTRGVSPLNTALDSQSAGRPPPQVDTSRVTRAA
jgi:O-antigen/teichoic acid export membrane protein